MSDGDVKGCPDCRSAVYSGRRDGLVLRSESLRLHARLWRCDACGAFWEEGEREAHVVSEAEARRDFPEAFRRTG